MELICKERKCVKLKPENLEVLHFEIENPIPEEVLEYIYTKEILVFLWKLGENDTRKTEEALKAFYETVAEPTPILDEHGENSTTHFIPPILAPADIVVGEEYVPPQIEKFKDKRISIRTQPQIMRKVEEAMHSNKPKIRVPAVWTPANRRATAAFIYIFFRNVRNFRRFLSNFINFLFQHTDHFLPPDAPAVVSNAKLDCSHANCAFNFTAPTFVLRV